MKRRILVLLLCLWPLNCEVNAVPTSLVRQQGLNDCAVAVLAMAANTPYPVIAALVRWDKLTPPLTMVQVSEIGEQVGLRITPLPIEGQNFGPDGIVAISGCQSKIGHAVWVHKGWVYDPTGFVMPAIQFEDTMPFCVDWQLYTVTSLDH